MSEQLSDYDYPLPRDLVASRPLPRREDSKMMVLRRDVQSIEDRTFRDLPAFIEDGDLLVLNNTRVLPARRFSDDGAIEFLFLEKLEPARWKCLVKPGRKMRVGDLTVLGGVSARVEEITDSGERVIALENDVDPYTGGSMPLPPYIERLSDTEDDSRYQTVFAQSPGAIAAPTAGLHFTPEILSQISHAFVTLHVGPGTFRPVQSEKISEHRMHSEQFSITAKAAERINTARQIIAVGTTSVRVLEAAQRCDGKLIEQRGATDIFIYPPFEFRAVNALLTNFHLPRSTLLMLVSAFAGREFILRAYADAIRKHYRFYSYGDCMLIL